MDLKGKKVLITGADGFIGSHLTEALLREGCRVRAFVYYNSFNSWGWLDSFEPEKLKQIDVFSGDVRDQNNVRKSMQDIDIVFHLAALIGIPFSYYAPDSYIDTNIKGTVNVLQAARDAQVKRVLVTSTSEVYGTAKKVPIEETHPLQGQSPYSASKIGADKIAESFFRSFALPVTIVRPFNTYGPRQSARAIIPTIIVQLLSGNKKIKLGLLSPKRDFNYVKDVCRGFLAIAKSNKAVGEEINIASGEEISISGLVKKIAEIISPGVNIEIMTESKRLRPEKSEIMRLKGSNKKIRLLTGWKPAYTLEAGLSETIDWIRGNIHCYKADIYNV